MFLCGIPKVTLEGTLENWLHLQEKRAKICDIELDIDFWLDRLEPVITYKNGWLGTLFPNNNYGNKIKKNEIDPGEESSGLVHVPFDLVTMGRVTFRLSFDAETISASTSSPETTTTSPLLNEVLEEYGLESEGIGAIPLFISPTHDIQNSDKYFEECITEINKR
ncbi:8683_t:CDS:2 [Diversispora eburnea]|uniref:8683_t:CDS:1 n=1 Tax=Diversispora eburnea TaxID=1213867 RepID=A0A9N8YYD1_9GLOM|nr:8683_t:CDS:2 [Diversispora eburnea]